MRIKLALLVLFTAAVSFACAGAQTRDQKSTRMGLELDVKPRATGSYKPVTLQRTELVLGGQCIARLTFDQESGGLKKVETDPPCVVTEDHLLVNNQEIRDISDSSISFGSGSKYCWYDPSVRKQQCVCRDLAC